MRPRFYVPDLDPNGQALLAPDEAAHLTRVLRLGLGADVEVLDGRGGMFRAEVVEAARAAVRVAIIAAAPAAPEPAVRITLVMSVLKGDKMDAVVRDAAMMGVAAIQPVVSSRTEVGLAALRRGHRVERWTRIAIASVKQCGRAVVPTIGEPIDLVAWIGQRGPEPALVLREPAGGTAGSLKSVPRSPAVQLLIGPEGGWAGEELIAFDSAGFVAVTLGGRTIRADAAPAVAMAALYQAWEAW